MSFGCPSTVEGSAHNTHKNSDLRIQILSLWSPGSEKVRSVLWETINMADPREGEDFLTPLELFEKKEVVRICAPMVRYSK